jgi:hypothetical protein
MANMKNNIDFIIYWLAKAFECLVTLIKAGESEKAGRLILDIQAVLNRHLLALKAFIPDKSVTPVPSNLLSKIAWLLQNSAFLNLLVSVTTEVSPFEEAKTEAKSVAMKWGFYNEVYGG